MAGVKGKSGMNPKSKANLLNLSETATKEEKSEKGRQAGIASGIAKRRKRALREIIEDVGSLSMKMNKELDEMDAFNNLKKLNLTADEMVIFRQYEKAIKYGDTRAAEFLRDTAGQKPTDKREITADVNSPLNGILAQLKEDNEDKE